MQTYRLFELNEYIRRVLALNLPEAVWVSCELADSRLARGHYFLQLLEKGEDSEDIIAQSEAVLWETTYRRLRRTIGRELDALLQEGMEVRLKVRVDFHERYGLKLTVEDVDPAYTLGKLELQRRQTIQELERLQLAHKNKRLPLPIVVQRIAVLSSEQAAGWQDFQEQLLENSYGYHIQFQLFASAVQGEAVRSEMLAQLRKIRLQRQKFDCVAIIRGGGARLDLTAFDDLELCKAIAEFPLPVLTGIGHDIDESIADLVAHTALKTPTAVADFIIQHNLHFESQVLEQGRQLQFLAQQLLQGQQLVLEHAKQVVQLKSQSLLHLNRQIVQSLEGEVPKLIHFHLRSERQRLENLATISHLLSLEESLKRGYSLTSRNGQLIRSAQEVHENDTLETQWLDGKVTSIITSK